eukprot:gb/GECH01008711.1/.p1 GENE.gb/GECH01008711.1/~~gb/GECH01008711.1/.p1  ORF type:complete len:169 (+),score=37.77 gb/GECH01008711.1/:1-507(+)
MSSFTEYNNTKLSPIPFNSKQTKHGTCYTSHRKVQLHIHQTFSQVYVLIDANESTSSSSFSLTQNAQFNCIMKGRAQLSLFTQKIFEDGDNNTYLLQDTAFSGIQCFRNNLHFAKIKKKFSFSKLKYKTLGPTINADDEEEEFQPITVTSTKIDPDPQYTIDRIDVLV